MIFGQVRAPGCGDCMKDHGRFFCTMNCSPRETIATPHLDAAIDTMQHFDDLRRAQLALQEDMAVLYALLTVVTGDEP